MSFRFITIDDPNAVPGAGNGTRVLGISSKTGVIVGSYSIGVSDHEVGFADFLGSYFNLPGPPGSNSWITTGINNLGNIVGVSVDNTGAHGYVDISAAFTILDDPKATQFTLPRAINDSGKIVGYYLDASQGVHAFTYSGGTFSDLNVPGAAAGAAALGINASGQIVGFYLDGGGVSHGFLDAGGVFTTLDVPFGISTVASSINDSGQIVGQYMDSSGQNHSFLYSNGVFTSFDDPRSAPGETISWGINNAGVIVGSYVDASDMQHGFVAGRSTAHDLFGVGTASVLWRNGSGLAAWDMNGSSIISSAMVTYQGQTLNPDPSWSLVGTADFNADGAADLLWRQNGGGPLALWQMSGATVNASNYVTYNGSQIAPDASWSVAGVGDFNANGEAAILWRQNTGSLAMWSMDGSAVTSSNTVTSAGSAVAPDASWSVAGIADFNGDGYSDILWRQNSGALALWDMRGSQVMSSAAVTSNGSPLSPDASWSLAGIGDFNNDGMADMLWRQNTGALALWQMNNAGVTSSSVITYQGNAVAPDATWKIVEIGDFDGNGSSDILWRNDNGSMAEWLMNGSQVTASITPSSQGNPVSPDASWNVQGKPTMFV